MTIESLNDYFSGSYKKTSLGKIYIAQKIREIIKKKTNQDVKVVIWGKEAKVLCKNYLVSQFMKNHLEEINREVEKLYKLTVKIKNSNS